MNSLTKLFDYYFWLTQPSSFLARADYLFAYFFVGCLALGIILGFSKKALHNQITAKVIARFYHLLLTIGFCGLLWFGFRFENTPIFALRYWPAIILLIGLIWALFILKYLVFNYRSEVKMYKQELLKNKYLPSSK